MTKGIELSDGLNYEDICVHTQQKPDKDCGEKHKLRVANATLQIAIDVDTDFTCESK
ncbi:MAG: hypothetical protein FWC92_06020 [Defluviitaleaceae bacterium]|nr:hypothetical protein [Defluviitaleaceae bacterium]